MPDAVMGARWVLVGLFWGGVPSMSGGFSELLDSGGGGGWGRGGGVGADECLKMNHRVLTVASQPKPFPHPLSPTLPSVHAAPRSPLVFIFLLRLWDFRILGIRLRYPLFPT